MSNRLRQFTFRLTLEEYAFLEQRAKEKKYKDLSSFVRETLFEKQGYSSAELNRQMKRLQWEVNKIGTNINQSTKRINSGYTDRQESVLELLSNQEQLIELVETYIKKVDGAWQSLD